MSSHGSISMMRNTDSASCTNAASISPTTSRTPSTDACPMDAARMARSYASGSSYLARSIPSSLFMICFSSFASLRREISGFTSVEYAASMHLNRMFAPSISSINAISERNGTPFVAPLMT